MGRGDLQAAEELQTDVALFTRLTKDDGLLFKMDAILRQQVEQAGMAAYVADPANRAAPREISQVELDAISAPVNMKVPKAAATSVVHRIAGEMATATGAQPEFDPLFRKSLAAVKQL